MSRALTALLVIAVLAGALLWIGPPAVDPQETPGALGSRAREAAGEFRDANSPPTRVTPVTTSPFSEAVKSTVCLKFVDAVTSGGIPGLTVSMGETRTLLTDSEGVVVVPELSEEEPLAISATLLNINLSFCVQWPADFEPSKDPRSETRVFVTPVSLNSRVCVRVSGVPPERLGSLSLSAKVIPPLPAHVVPIYGDLKLAREARPLFYPSLLEENGIHHVPLNPRIEFDPDQSAWMIAFAYTGDVAFQVALSGYASVARIVPSVQGESRDVFVVMAPAPRVSGRVRMNGSPVPGATVHVACVTDLAPGQLVADEGNYSQWEVSRLNASTTATFRSPAVVADDAGFFSVEVPFTDRVSVAWFDRPASNRIVFEESVRPDHALTVNVDAIERSDREAMMRLLDDHSGEVIGNTTVAFVDGPLACHYPCPVANPHGWFSIEDIKSLPSMTFLILRDDITLEVVMVEARPEPGGDLRVPRESQ